MDPLNSQSTCGSVVTRLPTSILVRCAGDNQWQMGLMAGVCAMYSRVFQAREILVSIDSQPAASHTLSPQSTSSDLARIIAASSPIPVGRHLDALIVSSGGRGLVEQQTVGLRACAADDGIDVSLETVGAVPPKVLARSLEFLLAAAARDHRCEIGSLPVLHVEDRDRVLKAWNATTWRPEVIQPIHRTFEIQVRRTPQAIALVDGQQSLTYAQLNCAANRLGARLRTEGVDVGSVVGLCVPRSAAMVVAMLGVLKSGGAFVPLDMSNPFARLQRMCTRAEPHILLFSRAEDKVCLRTRKC